MTEEYIPAYLDDSLDGRLSQARIEYLREKRNSKTKYREAVKFHDLMVQKKLRLSDKNLDKHDRMILLIRTYRRKFYLEWLEHEEEQNKRFDA